jgi:hypothetical protein
MTSKSPSFRALVFLLLWPLLLAPSAQDGQAQASVTDNGIVVGEPKVYDNAALQQMLDSARARLASMQFLDPTAVAARIGSLQGASMQQSGISFSVGGPPMAGLQTTANTGNTVTTANQGITNTANTGSTTTTTGGTANSGSTTTTTGSTTTSGATPGSTATQQVAVTGPSSTGTEQLAVTGPSSTAVSTGNLQTAVTGPSTQTVTTLAQQNPSAAPAPAMSTFTLPSSFGPSASNVLNEQVELNSEVESLSLLLEGALSDQFYQDGGVSYPKRRVTIGIPVTIIPSRKYKDEVAEIDLSVASVVSKSNCTSPPAITAILPQSKTYNVASISSKSTSIGGGIVTGVLTAGVNFAWQKQTYYIVQDQDTVALQYPYVPGRNSITFGWQLRPVLGRHTVSSGMRTLFVQLALPPDVCGTSDNLATVAVTTAWKRVDRKTNAVDSHPIDSVSSSTNPVPKINAAPQIGKITGPVDNGDGTVTVHLESTSYLQGAYIKIGTATIPQGSPLVVFDPSHIDFTLPAALLTTQKGFLADRSGASTEIVDPRAKNDTADHCISIDTPSMVPVTSSLGRLTVHVKLDSSSETCKYMLPEMKLHDLVAAIGNRVFGYRDSPIAVDSSTGNITFLAPIDLLRTSPEVTILRPLWGEPFRAKATFSAPLVPTIDKAPVVSKSGDNLQIALFGSNLQQLTPPAGMKFNAGGKACDQPGPLATDTSNTARILCVPQSLTSAMDQIPLRASSGDLLLIAMPTDPNKDTPALAAHSPILAGKALTLTFTGSHLDGFTGAKLGKTAIAGAKLAKDNKSIDVPLTAAMVTSPSIELTFSFKDTHPLVVDVQVIDRSLQVTQPAAKPPA